MGYGLGVARAAAALLNAEQLTGAVPSVSEKQGQL